MEIEAVLNQIQPAMTPEQLAAIKEMRLTPDDMQAMDQQLSLSDQRSGGTGPGGGRDLSPEERATAMADRMNSGFGTALIETLIELLEARAGE